MTTRKIKLEESIKPKNLFLKLKFCGIINITITSVLKMILW